MDNSSLLPFFTMNAVFDIAVAVIISVTLSLVAFYFIYHRAVQKKLDTLMHQTKQHKKGILSELRRIEKKAEIEEREKMKP